MAKISALTHITGQVDVTSKIPISIGTAPSDTKHFTVADIDIDTLYKTNGLLSLPFLEVDNLRLDGNTISSTDTNGNVVIDMNGSGVLVIDQINMNGNLITSNAGTALTVQSATGQDLNLGDNGKIVFNGGPEMSNVGYLKFLTGLEVDNVKLDGNTIS